MIPIAVALDMSPSLGHGPVSLDPESPVVSSTFVVERDFRAPPERVFAALEAADARRTWFESPGGPADALEATYHDVVPDRRIVYAYDLIRDGVLVSVSLTTIDISPAEPSGTMLMLTEQGVFFDGLDDPAAREKGTLHHFDALSALLDED